MTYYSKPTTTPTCRPTKGPSGHLEFSSIPPIVKRVRAMCVKCAPATSATSLMTRIQNGGRGDGEWKSELLLSLQRTLPSHSAQSVSGELSRS